MAREPVYRAGVSPGGSPVYSGANAEAFGAGIGRAITNIGEGIDRIKQIDRDREASQAGVDMAKVTGDLDVYAQQQRDQAAAGGDGHTEAVNLEIDKMTEAALSQIKDKRVRAAYRERYAEFKSRVVTRETSWQSAARVDNLVTGIDETGTIYANQQATAPTPEGLDLALGNVDTQVGLLEASEDLKHKLAREQKRKIVVAWGNAMVDQDHATLGAAIKSGVLNPFLEPEDIERLSSGVHVEGRRQEAAAKAQRSADEADAREKISLFNRRVEAGDMPSDDEFAAHSQLAKTYGLTGQEFDVGVKHSEVVVNRETRDWTPVQFDQAINDLRAKGDKLSTAENVQLAQLEKIRGGRVQDFVNNPQGYAARIGKPAPALDWESASQGAVDARVTWARSMARSAGLPNPPYLSGEEMRPLRERADQGAAGKLDVSQQLRQRFGAGVGAEIARQLEPDDKAMQLMVGLPDVTATRYGLGIQARARNPKLFNRDDALEIFQEYASAIPAELRTPVFEAASNIASAIVDQKGGDEFDKGAFRDAVNWATGATSRAGADFTGGIGDWKGNKIWLPSRVSMASFNTRIARANGAQIVGAAVNERGEPTNMAARYMGTDGRPGRNLEPAEWKQLQFETVSPGVYRVRGPIGGVLVDGKGRPWMFDVRRLP